MLGNEHQEILDNEHQVSGQTAAEEVGSLMADGENGLDSVVGSVAAESRVSSPDGESNLEPPGNTVSPASAIAECQANRERSVIEEPSGTTRAPNAAVDLSAIMDFMKALDEKQEARVVTLRGDTARLESKMEGRIALTESKVVAIDHEMTAMSERINVTEQLVKQSTDENDKRCQSRADRISLELSALRADAVGRDEMVVREFETVIRDVSKNAAMVDTLQSQVEKTMKDVEEKVAPIDERLREFRERVSDVQKETIELRRTTGELSCRITELERAGNIALEQRIAALRPTSCSDLSVNAGALVSQPGVNTADSSPRCEVASAMPSREIPINPEMTRLDPPNDRAQFASESEGTRVQRSDSRYGHTSDATCGVLMQAPKTLAKVKLSELPRFSTPAKQHPVEFLNCIEKYFRVRKCHLDAYLDEIMGTLDGPAEQWLNVDVQHVDSYAEFKEKFLERYWAEATQVNVRNDIIRGKYDDKKDGSMAEYFRFQVSRLRYIDPPLSDREITSIMVRHYDDSVSRILKLNSSWTVPSLASYLDTIEPTKGEGAPRGNITPHNHPQPKRENPNQRYQQPQNQPQAQRQGPYRQQDGFRRGDVRNGVYHVTYNEQQPDGGNGTRIAEGHWRGPRRRRRGRGRGHQGGAFPPASPHGQQDTRNLEQPTSDVRQPEN